MGRPKTPLISRDKALAAALEIIDMEGIESLSIRRLAAELNVNGASLYHHFANKEDILIGATELALSKTPIRVSEQILDWQDWLVDGARQLRDVLLAHPGLISIIVQRRTLGVRADTLEAMTARLIRKGVPADLILPIYESLERFVIGSAIREARAEGVFSLPQVDDETYPSLNQATTERELIDDDLFDMVSRGIISAILASTLKDPFQPHGRWKMPQRGSA